MGTKLNRGASSIWIVLIIVLTVLFAADKFLGLVARNRQQQAQGSAEIRNEAMRYARGEALSEKQFPNTPEGRVSAIMHELLLDAQNRESMLQLGLNRIDWNWVETPEAISSKANLARSLKIIAQGKQLYKKYASEFERSRDKYLRHLKRESKDNEVARQVLESAVNGKAEKSTTYYWSKKSIAAQLKHIDAMEGMAKFLSARIGKYRVDGEGTVEFSSSVPEKELVVYDKFCQVFDETEEQVEQIAQMQFKQARQIMR